MNSLAVLSQSFSGAQLFMGDALHGPQSSPVLPAIAALQKGALGGTEFCCIEISRSRYPLVGAESTFC